MRKRYGALDGLRAYACIGIVMMHVLANGGYELPGFIGTRMIPSFTNFVFLFMTISAFGLCCGYYERFENGTINLENFYKKRFMKILPFFALLSIIDVVLSPSKEAMYELFANITLLFGLLPNANITVIGVGWFLGVIFVFYLLFPFFTVLLKTKRRAWIAFAVAVIYNVLCQVYFMDSAHVVQNVGMRTNIVYCFMFFMAGGLIYLHREKIEQINVWIMTGLAALNIVAYYLIGGNVFMCLLVSITLLMLGITASYETSENHRGGGLENRFTAFLGGISMEIYLCHMVFFRVLEKIHMTRIFDNDIVSYVITTVVVLIMASVFSVVMKKLINMAMKKLKIVV